MRAYRGLFRLGLAIVLVSGTSSMLRAGESAAEPPHFLLANFTEPLAFQQGGGIQADEQDPKVGLAAGRLKYRFEPKQPHANFQFQDGRISFKQGGTLKVWIKGNGSGHGLELRFQSGRPKDGGFQDRKNLPSLGVKLDFTGWREFSVTLSDLDDGHLGWWAGVGLGAAKAKDGEPPVLEGEVGLDDLRLYPRTHKPRVTLATALLGPRVRGLENEFKVAVDVRNFSKSAAQVQLRLKVLDRNEAQVASQQFSVQVPAGPLAEHVCVLRAEQPGAYLPPFRLTGDVLSPDFEEIERRLDEPLVVGNTKWLLDDFSDVEGRWLTSGVSQPAFKNTRGWIEQVLMERQRVHREVQTVTKLSRVEIPAGAEGAPAQARYAMAIDFDGEAVAYTGVDRYLPGNAYRLGLWVHGDGSGAKLSVLILDHTNSIGPYNQIWQRMVNGEMELAKLDFTGWKYVEVVLPGNGLGGNSPEGSTGGVDYPLEWAALRVDGQGSMKGRVLIGPAYVTTQLAQADCLRAFLGYDAPAHAFSPAANAWATVHNGWTTGSRNVQIGWSVRDGAGEELGVGRYTVTLAAGASDSRAIDLKSIASKWGQAPGPLQLVLQVHDTADASVQAKRVLVLAKPDSEARVADFEEDRPYFGSEPLASSSEQAKQGKRALVLSFDEKKKPLEVHIDRALPGKPCRATLWVHGDGSGGWLYALQGFEPGATRFQLEASFLLARAVDSNWQNAHRVDWTGWKQVSFDLPLLGEADDRALENAAFLPLFPVGLHLGFDPRGSEESSGRIFIDDVRVQTHLPPGERLSLQLDAGAVSGFSPDGRLELSVDNLDRSAPAEARVKAEWFDSLGVTVGSQDAQLTLAPGESRQVTLAESLGPGAYAAHAVLLRGETKLGEASQRFVVGDLKSALGDDPGAALKDLYALRKALNERFERVEEDWDWVEHYKGNFQLQSYLQKVGRATGRGLDPYGLLGFSAYWAAGAGFEQAEAGAFSRRKRFIGGAVNIFMAPERQEDWDHYVCETLRGMGAGLPGWLIWNGPDNPGPLHVPPPRFAEMLGSAIRWRDEYAPATKLYIGGMRLPTALAYLQGLEESGVLKALDGIELRVDMGGLSAEDAYLTQPLAHLQAMLDRQGPRPKQILIGDLNWDQDESASGADAFRQAACLSRALLLLHPLGTRTTLDLTGVQGREGTSLMERTRYSAPPLKLTSSAYRLKPSWWAVCGLRERLKRWQFVRELTFEEALPGRTRGMLFKDPQGAAVAAIWRIDGGGTIDFGAAGLEGAEAEGLFGERRALGPLGLAIGSAPAYFRFKGSAAEVNAELDRSAILEPGEKAPLLRALLEVRPVSDAPAYAQQGGQPYRKRVETLGKVTVDAQGLAFGAGGTETLTVDVPAGQALLVRKTFVLEGSGHRMEVSANEKPVGEWDLKASDAQLSGGLREVAFLVPADALGGSPKAKLSFKYLEAGNSVGWRVAATAANVLPLTAIGPLHGDQSVPMPIRWGRNAAGGSLRVDTDAFDTGLGVWARSLVEYPLEGRFVRFTGRAGVDAVTGGRGSVQFEIYLDGKRVWASGRMTGLDKAKAFSVDCSAARRLRLVVEDSGDGNALDAANWCETMLQRQE
ncbi:MAG: NPCBM/NEW2 domain-containing protein [Planctomycetes bacterium]|nr:NPCBM/NEW2 domain-containing protein [Planctomycetota bacterium]